MSRRTPINGALLDITAASLLLGCSERALRARVARRVVPFRRWNGRVVFRRTELESFVETLPGVTLEQAKANANQKRRDHDAQ